MAAWAGGWAAASCTRELARNHWQARRYRHATLYDDTGDGPRTTHLLAVDAAAKDGAPLLLQVSDIWGSQEAWQPWGTLWLAGDPRTRRRTIVGLPAAGAMSLYCAARLRDDLRARALAALPPG